MFMAAASVSRLRNPGLFYLYAMLAPGRTHGEVEAAIDAVVTSVVKNGVTEAEVQRAKNQLRAQESFGRDGPFAIASQLNEAIAAGDWKLFTTIRARIDRVTREEVRRVARTYLDRDRCTTGWYVPE